MGQDACLFQLNKGGAKFAQKTPGRCAARFGVREGILLGGRKKFSLKISNLR